MSTTETPPPPTLPNWDSEPQVVAWLGYLGAQVLAVLALFHVVVAAGAEQVVVAATAQVIACAVVVYNLISHRKLVSATFRAGKPVVFPNWLSATSIQQVVGIIAPIAVALLALFHAAPGAAGLVQVVVPAVAAVAATVVAIIGMATHRSVQMTMLDMDAGVTLLGSSHPVFG